MKKVLTVLLSALLIIGMLPFGRFAAETDITTYYVSADGNGDGLSQANPMSLSSLNSKILTGGTRVLFKCGDTFYGKVTPITTNTSAQSGIELATYGSGAMPIFSGAKIIKSSWTNAGNGFYKYNLTDTAGFEGLKTTDTNICFIENNAGKKYGVRCLDASSCTNEYDFYCDEQFIYIKTANEPFATLGELKLACGISVFAIGADMTLHDLHIRDAGYGIVWKTKTNAKTKNVKIYNCVFDNFGGHYIGGLNSGTKGGNAIEFYGYATDCVIENNIIRNCYDVGFTCQGSGTWSNVAVNNNVFAYNTQAIEIWCKDMVTGQLGVDGMTFENNICIGQGQGWGYDVRPNKRVAADVLSYRYEATDWDMTISGNLFFHSNSNGAVYYSSLYSKEKMISLVTPNENNIYVSDASNEIFKDDYNGMTIEQWRVQGCDNDSNFNIITNYFRVKKLEQTALYSYDFNEILSEVTNADLQHNAVPLTRDTGIVAGMAPYAQIEDEGNILYRNGEIAITPHQISTSILDWTATTFDYEGKTLADAYVVSGLLDNLTNGDYGDYPSTDVCKLNSVESGTLTAKEIALRRLAVKIDLGGYYNMSSIKIDTANGGWAAARRIFGYNVYGVTDFDDNTILNNSNLLGSYLSDTKDYYYNSPREAILTNAENIRYVVIVFNLLGTDPGVKDNTILTDLTGAPVVPATSYIYADVNGSNSGYASSVGMTFLSEIEVIGKESDYVLQVPQNILINNGNIRISPIQIATEGLDWTKTSFSYEGMEISDAYTIAGTVNNLINGDDGTYPSTDVMSFNSVKEGTLTAKEIATRRLALKIDLGGYYKTSSVSVDTANATWSTGRMLYSYNVYGSPNYNSNTILNDENLIGSFMVNGDESSSSYYWSNTPRRTDVQGENIRYVVIVLNLLGTDPGIKDNSIMTDLAGVPVVPAESYIFRDVNGTNSGYTSYVGRPFLSEIEIIGIENKNYVEGYMPGDVTGDKVIDIRDLVLMKKYFSLSNADIIESNLDFNGDGAKDTLDLVQVRKYLLTLSGYSESSLSNTRKLLENEKELTIGYLGGSITLGTSARNIVENGVVTSALGGDIMDSWVNRVSSWFAEQYQDATIETVNAGVGDTATNMGLFRLESQLMNENGHKMPDLVFVEFTNNDWVYPPFQSYDDLKLQIESLFRNIWTFNPYAEIIFISTNVNTSYNSCLAYREVCEYYGVPYIDVGKRLAELKAERGTPVESNGSYYYTVDNLHPSAEGYKQYFEVIKAKLVEYLDFEIKWNTLFNYNKAMPKANAENLISSPEILTSADVEYTADVTAVQQPVTVSLYGTSTTVITTPKLTEDRMSAPTNSVITANFTGSCLGLLIQMTANDVSLQYRVDNGGWKTLIIDDSNFGFQRYNHSQVFMLEHNLSDTNHIVEIKITATDNVLLGGLLVNQ